MAMNTRERAALTRKRKKEGYSAYRGVSLDDIGIGLKKNKNYTTSKEFNKALQKDRKEKIETFRQMGRDLNARHSTGKTNAEFIKENSRDRLNRDRKYHRGSLGGNGNKKFLDNDTNYNDKKDNEKLAHWLAANKGGKSGKLESFVTPEGKLQTKVRHMGKLIDNVDYSVVLDAVKKEKRLNRKNRQGIKDPSLKESGNLRKRLTDIAARPQRATGKVSEKMKEINKGRTAKMVPIATGGGRVLKYGFDKPRKYTGKIDTRFKPDSGFRYETEPGNVKPTAEQKRQLSRVNRAVKRKSNMLRWGGQ